MSVKKASQKHFLIFDFDGTIADTHKFIIEISNRLSQEFQYKEILPKEMDNLKNKSTQEIIRHLKIPIMKIPSIIAKAKKEYYRDIHTLNPIQGLAEILHKLDAFGQEMGILSSNSKENVQRFLNDHQMNIFDFVQTTSKVWSKNTSLKKLIKRHGLLLEEIIYVGDEIRDIVAAQKLGIKVAAVAWGYNSAKTLKKHKPDFLLTQPEDLIKLCH